MKHARRLRPATAFPFILGVFSGTLLTAFLFLAVRSIEDMEGESLPGMEARGDSKLTNRNRLEPSSQLTSGSETQRKVVFLPRIPVSFNVLVSEEKRGLAILKTWAGETTTKKNVDFYLLPSAQLDKESVLTSLKKTQVVYLEENKDKDIDRKSRLQGVFELWKDVCEKTLNKYHWFVHLKDTVYLQADKLEEILNSLNSSKAILFGRSVKPVGYARDELGLREGESYCFEGGYAVSWKTLEMVCPFLSTCQDGAKSENEDVEIARCIKEHAGINCTANAEVYITSYRHNTTVGLT